MEDNKDKIKTGTDYLSINVSSLYSSISRMSENSGRVKTLFLPFVGIVLSTEYGTVFCSGNEWFSCTLHQYIFGLIMSFVLLLCSAVFVWLDNFYLKYGRRYRKIYKEYCLNKDGIGNTELLDIGRLQNEVSIKRRPSRNSIIYYFSVDLIVIFAYFITIFIISRV